jgi:hypothetical protein
MAQTYTLDEAAGRLGIAPEELKRRLREDWKTIRSFRDGATLRFRAADIDDLARSLGQASDPGGLQPGDGKTGAAADFFVPPGDSDSSEELSFKSADGGGKKPKKPGDSDIRLDGTSGPKLDPNENQPTEEISLDVSGPGSKVKAPGSGKISAPNSGSFPGAKIKGPSDVAMTTDSSSEFELSLDSDSDSFELDLNAGSGDKPLAAKSGITLDKPADGGVSLNDSDESLDFDLSLDAPEPKGSKSKSKPTANDSDSEFELALDDNSGVTDNLAAELREDAENKGDIFETDFDMPAVDDSESGSEVVAVDSSDLSENSDFDLALDESDVQVEEDDSASQVVLIDDDEDAAPARGGKGRAMAGGGAAVLLDDSDVDSPIVSRRLDDDDGPVRVIQAAGPKWGALPAVMGFATLPFVFLGTIMSFELLKGMTGYNAPGGASGPVVKGVAGLLGMAPNEKN